jgi:hypothetical protein
MLHRSELRGREAGAPERAGGLECVVRAADEILIDAAARTHDRARDPVPQRR